MSTSELNSSLWLVQPQNGECRLCHDFSEVIQLILEHRIDRHALIYQVSAAPNALGDLPGLTELFDDASLRNFLTDRDSKGQRAPIASDDDVPFLETISPLGATEHAFADDLYEIPRRRAPAVIALAATVAVLAGGGYLALHHSSSRPAPAVVAAEAPLPPPSIPPAPVAAPAPAPVVAVPEPTPVAAARSEGASKPTRKARMEAPARALGRSAPRATRAPRLVSTSNPGTYEELVREGEKLAAAGRAKDAMALFERALEIRPDGPEAINGVAHGWLARGDARRAAPMFQRAFAKDAHLSAALFGLGRAYREQGRRKEARDAFTVYLMRFPDGRHANAARRQIQELNAAARS